MKEIYQHRDFVQYYLLQFAYYISFIDLISPPNKFSFLCRMSEETKFISVDRKVIICVLAGKKLTAENYKLFRRARHKF